MTASIGNAVTVSFISMSVIFIVLTILIFTINLLVKLLPYQAPPAPAKKKAAQAAQAPGASESDEHIAAITGAMNAHLGQNAGNLNIRPL